MITDVAMDTLVTIEDLRDANFPVSPEHRTAMESVVTWSRDYLCKSHPALGRKGPVCPYVAKAMEKNLFFMNVYDGGAPSKAEVAEMMLGYQEQFLAMEPTQGPDAIFKCIMVMFPNLPKESAQRIIDESQSDLIAQFTPNQLMIGEFHPGPPKKVGLWNDKFQPLWCPIPMLVIRQMVNTDILFLRHHRENTINYLKFYGDDIPVRMRGHVEEAVARFDIDFELAEAVV